MHDFLQNGIRFQCQGCGTCCTGDPGAVYVSYTEIENIAAYLDVSVNEFIRIYTYIYKNNYCLLELKDGSCVFYRDGCTIYGVRPNQCRTYPFWLQNIRNTYNWKQVNKECPGLGKGCYYSRESILDIAFNSVL